MRCMLLAVCVLALLLPLVSADLSFNSVHLVDHIPESRAFFFRSNEPTKNNDKEFAYDELLNYMSIRARAANLSFPPASEIYMLDITFQNLFDTQWAEKEFWRVHTDIGRLEEWTLATSIVWPHVFTPEQQRQLIGNGTIWLIDKLPQRVAKLRSILQAGAPKVPGKNFTTLVVVGHCTFGCDRTGEFMAGYRMTYEYKPTLREQYKLACEECGRCPIFSATGAIAWYCLTFNYNVTAPMQPLPDCLTGYHCKLFGECQLGNETTN